MSNLLINVFTSGTDIVRRLQKILDDESSNFSNIVVNLYEAGIRYDTENGKQTFVDFIKENSDKRNISYYGCNFSNQPDLPLHFLNNMFHEGSDLYIKNEMCRGLLEQCVDVKDKSNDLPKFDLLLGGTTPTKDWLYDVLKKHKVCDKVFATYYRDDPKQGEWSSYVKVPVNHTAETIEDRWKSTLRYSDLIDPKIYNKTFYTALIETAFHEDFGVFTEKTAKPIVAKRPFVIFGSPGQLQALRSLGFKTFSTVIDESYDKERDMYKRFNMVLDTMLKLSSIDPKSVYTKLDEILQHNKNHFEKTDWNRQFRQQTRGSKKIDLFRFEQ